MLVDSVSIELFLLAVCGLFSPLGDRVLAKPMKYASLARLTLSLVSCNWSSGSRSCIDLCLFVPCFPAFFDLLISLGQ